MKLNRRRLRRLIESVILEQSEDLGLPSYIPGHDGEDIIVGAGEEYRFKASSAGQGIPTPQGSAGLLVHVKDGDHTKVALQGRGYEENGRTKDLHVTDDDGGIVIGLHYGNKHFTFKNSGSQPVTIDIAVLTDDIGYPK